MCLTTYTPGNKIVMNFVVGLISNHMLLGKIFSSHVVLQFAQNYEFAQSSVLVFQKAGLAN
jgi:hypothetical protein